MKERIYTCYSSEADTTFIMKQQNENGVIKTEEVIGFYWGYPNEKSTEEYTGKLKAVFNE